MWFSASRRVQAAPDLQLVLDAVAKERADFREDLASTSAFFQEQLAAARAAHTAEVERLSRLLEDQRRHIDGLTATTHTLAIASRAPAVAASAAMQESEVMDDARELQIERQRAEAGQQGIDYSLQENAHLADGIVERAIRSMNGAPR